MKKIKKILLAFAPLAAITIATPIVLTACSDTSNVTPPGGDTTIKPSFEKDSTNSATFELPTNSEAAKILENYKKAEGKEAADKVLDDALNGFPKDNANSLATDVINMWSNNNWFAINKSAQDQKVKETFISKLTINSISVTGGKATIDAKYQNAFTDKNNRVFEAEQVIEAKEVTVDTNTSSIDVAKSTSKYTINGETQSLESTSLFATTDDVAKTNFENFLKLPKVSLDAKKIFTNFITNHEINHAEKPSVPTATAPVWNKTEVDKDSTLSYVSETEIVLQLNATANKNWGSCLNTTSYESVVAVMKNTTYSNKLKNLISTNDYENPTLEYGPEIKNTNDSDMDITIKFTKKASSQGEDKKPTLTFKIKGFKKTA